MKSTLYGTYRTFEFNPDNIIYILEEGYKCDTHFNNGRTLLLSWRDTKQILKKFPRVYSYDIGCGVYINPRELAFYEEGTFVNITFNDGSQLKELSNADFNHNVKPILNNLSKEDFTL